MHAVRKEADDLACKNIAEHGQNAAQHESEDLRKAEDAFVSAPVLCADAVATIIAAAATAWHMIP
jgi:hypothetical protein